MIKQKYVIRVTNKNGESWLAYNGHPWDDLPTAQAEAEAVQKVHYGYTAVVEPLCGTPKTDALKNRGGGVNIEDVFRLCADLEMRLGAAIEGLEDAREWITRFDDLDEAELSQSKRTSDLIESLREP